MLVDNTITKGVINYYYSATGEKLYTLSTILSQRSLNPIENTDESPDISTYATPTKRSLYYQGNKVYDVTSGRFLDKILLNNGYIQDGNYYFYLRDHLGNNNVATARQNYFYYPFGMPLGESGTSGHWDMEEDGIQPYKYGGKEFDSMHGINLYDFHARQYDSVLGRFTSVDPLAEKYYNISPYAYCANNPIKNIDPDGKDWFNHKENGNVIFVKGIEDLSSMDEDILETYAIGDISQYERLGADNMFGNNVTWGIYGEDGGSFNVLETSFLALGDLSANFTLWIYKAIIKRFQKKLKSYQRQKETILLKMGENLVGYPMEKM